MRGTVKWFSPPKGFGFITGEDGSDYYVHFSDINGEGFRSLKGGEEVIFDTTMEEKGARAINVTKAAKAE